MKFRIHCSKLLRAFFNWFREPSLGSTVSPNEVITLGIFQSNHFNSNRVMPGVFAPPSNKKKSVGRIIGLSESGIWEYLKEYVEQNRRGGAKLKARADIKVSVCLRESLNVVSAPPPDRHANIIDWPDEAKWKSISQELANSAGPPIIIPESYRSK